MQNRAILCVFVCFSFIGNSALAMSAEQQLEELLSQHSGKVVYVDFWASWCVPCRYAFPWMGSIQKRFSQDVQIIAVNMDTDVEDAKKFLLETPANFPVIFNPSMSIGQANKLKGMPSSIIFDRTGKKIVQLSGFNDEKKKDYEAILIHLVKSR
ncbi:TlpA disulfide reductase family protein [Pseudoalteromonas sp. MMG012]|uniref:TlpA family protein disulfide reductase n=1 Tax=Pseudoalteromonas sp. MMG012 TaxID=2822686 RepID=UPI001B3A127B|nr:TlpA disulfide reductase family protein [Pseudoalteromonas sp. MMG012]MBQ4851880.1 TlpA family protein disulfide reductase [Pseudoalteromonas sp. MMG012]